MVIHPFRLAKSMPPSWSALWMKTHGYGYFLYCGVEGKEREKDASLADRSLMR